MRRLCAFTIGTAIAVHAIAAAAADDIGEIHVTAERLAPAANEPMFATDTLDHAALEETGAARLDSALLAVPGFSLFRRQESRWSHPTTQGVTLRGLGPSGAGRTLVLLDGVPQNDPFGGWIDWSRLPVAAIDTVSLTRGGGAGAWGDEALAGTLKLERAEHIDAHAFGEVRGQTPGNGDVYAGLNTTIPNGTLRLDAQGHTGQGPYLIRADQRGPVDVRTADDGYSFDALSRWQVTADTQLSISGATSLDRYTNGIAIAKSRTRISDAAVGLVHQSSADAVAYEAHGYVRGQNLASLYAGIDAARAVATPSLDQYHTPAMAWGGNALVRVPLAADLSLDAGVDGRHVDGSTNENFQYTAGAFTRQRHAGGAQDEGGAFGELTWTPVQALSLTAEGRIDTWRQTDGYRQEVSAQSGATLRDDHYANRSGDIGNFRAGAVYDAGALKFRAVAYSGFRIPTLNELYRPFRVGNDITEANPALKPERLIGAEAGLDARLADTLTLSLTYFNNRLNDAISNVTVQTTPGMNAALGVVVPAGGVLRQRRNIERTTAQGIEADGTWKASAAVELTTRFLYTNPEVARSRDAPNLVGLLLPEVSRYQAFIGASWHLAAGMTLHGDLHLASSQFDDDINTRKLSGYAVADLTAEAMITRALSVFAGIDNLFDRTIEAGESATGVFTVGSPRTFQGGLRLTF